MSFKRILLVRPRSRCGWGFMWSPLAINLEYIAASILDVVDEVRIVNQEFDDRPIEFHLKDYEPDLLGVTMSATEHTAGLDNCRRVKKRVKGVATVVGGFHPTAVPDLMLSNPAVDMVAVGEAEMTMRELVQKGSPEGVAGLIHRDGGGKTVRNPRRETVKDLDTLPFPARHLRAGDECELSLKRYGLHRDQIHTSRGCWGKCTFCCEPNMSASKQRFRKPEKVMEELKGIYEMHHREPMFILLGDPHFMGKPAYTERFCDMLIAEDMDIKFTAMVRADMISRYPELAAKMVKAGIIGYCLGLESPGEGDLGDTKKGISTQAQREAVRILRRNHAIAGGTFVCGLPGHTEEEIFMFPEYARNLGIINSAFPVATPHAATEFYSGLDRQNLIADRKWENYDQMHLVFRHEVLTPARAEEILTQCMGRFYAPDIFLDDMIAEQFRDYDGRKMSLRGAIHHFMDRMNFILDASKEYKTIEDGTKMGSMFLLGQVNPHTRKRTEAIGIHNVVDMRRLLSHIGKQRFSATVRYGGKPFVSYLLATRPDRVEYIDVTGEPRRGTTVGFTLDMEDASMLKRDRGRFAVRMLGRLLKESRLSSLVRISFAVLAEYLRSGHTRVAREKIALPDGFLDHFCASDGWDWEKYRRIQERKREAGRP